MQTNDNTAEMPNYVMSEQRPDFHAVISITLGELINSGMIDWDAADWKWDYYDEEQYTRVCKKIEDHYWDREIGILPPGLWKRRYLNKMNEIMPKYKYAYNLIERGVDILQNSDTYYKGRNVYSDFPATQLKTDNQDYASNANDSENETVSYGNFLDTMAKLKDYNDVDVMIVEELEPLFSCLYTVNINSY